MKKKNKPNVTGRMSTILTNINFFASLFVIELVLDSVNFVQMRFQTTSLGKTFVTMITLIWFDA